MSSQYNPPAITFHTTRRHRAVILTVSGDIDLTTAGLFRQRLAGLLRSRPRRLTIDLSCARYVDVAGARAIAGVARALPPGSPLVLRSPTPIACRIFQLTGLDQICVIEAAPAPRRPAPDRPRRASAHRRSSPSAA